MDKIIEITQALLKKQARNKRNFICAQIPVFVVVLYLFYPLLLMVPENIINADFVFNTLFFIIVIYLLSMNIKRFNMFNAAVQYHVIPRIININNFDSTNNWLKQNKNLFPKTIIGQFFSNKMNYSVWGCIETNDNYQVVIIDLSKKNTLLVLTIEKKDLDSYTESKFLTQLIQRIPKRKKFNELWFKKYFFSHLTFYIYE